MGNIKINSIFGNLIFEYDIEENTIQKTLIEAIKRSADLRSADLRSADLRSADLSGAGLRSADLRSANLRSANLSGANLSGADLRSADYNENTAFFVIQCPEEGSFIAWKKASGCLVKLMICKTAKRSSATTLKCRCSSAKIIGIYNMDFEMSDQKTVSSDHDSDFIYTVGKISKVDDFDEDRWNECSTGIHFFMSKEVAKNY
jgi:hypothetical protein